MNLRTEIGQRAIKLDPNPLGQGGEAKVYRIVGDTACVAKIYHDSKDAEIDKLRQMIAYPPVTAANGTGGSVAWPQDLLLGSQGEVLGFLMPAVRNTHALSIVYFPDDRRRFLPQGFGYLHLLRTARNLCIAVDSVHQAGYVVGDLNDGNVMVSADARVTLIDCDSFQVGRYVSRLMLPEYAAPEVYTADWSTYRRTQEEDYFALAIMIHLLLMEGAHPFAGVGQPSQLDERIRAGLTPYKPNGPQPPRAALPPEFLTPGLRHLFIQAFVKGHGNPALRPSAEEWRDELARAEQAVKRCRWGRPAHWYFNHSPKCLVCAARRPAGRSAAPTASAPATPAQVPLHSPLDRQTVRRVATFAALCAALGFGANAIGIFSKAQSDTAPSVSLPALAQSWWRSNLSGPMQAQAPEPQRQEAPVQRHAPASPRRVPAIPPAVPTVPKVKPRIEHKRPIFSSPVSTETGSEIYRQYLGEDP